MKSVQTIIAIATIAALSVCSTVMTTAHSGYLSDYSALAEAPDAASASRAAARAIDPAQVSISEVVWRVDARSDIGNDERDALLAQLQRELQQGVQALPASPQGRPAQIRAAITRVETVSPALNTVGTLLLIGPLDRGGAAVEIEAVDRLTGRQLAALRLGYFAPLSDIEARFSKLAPAEIALRKAAVDFAALLQPASVAAKLASR
ncbi:DUF3313 family protein [Ideonella sp. A 288]|uniref:DUF3313 family protein n=1 Tax=Ideonella sp. A 288 TaxID=1962181 RepID=UPI000B4B87EF|nr:DUF3313 family protein [Ideonella sp. A 288]